MQEQKLPADLEAIAGNGDGSVGGVGGVLCVMGYQYLHGVGGKADPAKARECFERVIKEHATNKAVVAYARASLKAMEENNAQAFPIVVIQSQLAQPGWTRERALANVNKQLGESRALSETEFAAIINGQKPLKFTEWRAIARGLEIKPATLLVEVTARHLVSGQQAALG